MNEQQQPASAGTAEGLSEMSLADYRAQREGRAEAPQADPDPKAKDESTAGEPAGENDEAAEDTAEETEHAADDAADPKPRKKGGFQRKLEQRDREIADLKAQLADKSAGKPEDKQPQEKQPEYSVKKPVLADFESLEEYAEALTDWKADQREFIRNEREAQAKAENEHKTILDGWNSRQAEARKQHSDYDEVLSDVDDLKLSPAHQRIFLESEHGPEIAYELAKDRKQLEKFSKLEPLAAARFIGTLEAALESDKEAPKPVKTASQAPKPIRPVSGNRAAGVQPFDIAGSSLADYRKARETGKVR